MTRIEQDSLKWHQCSNCYGTWITMLALMRRVRLDAQGDIKALAGLGRLEDLAEIVTAADTKAALRCPQCEKPMSKDRFHVMIPVKLDICRGCQQAWLDTGEFSLLRLLWHELTNSNDPELLRRREKIATVNADWNSRTKLVDEISPASGPIGDDFDGFNLLTYILGR